MKRGGGGDRVPATRGSRAPKGASPGGRRQSSRSPSGTIQAAGSDINFRKDGPPLNYTCYSKGHDGHAEQRFGLKTPRSGDGKQTSTHSSPEGLLETSSKIKSKNTNEREAYSGSPVSKNEDPSNFKEVTAATYFPSPESSSSAIHEPQHGTSSFSEDSKNDFLNTPSHFSPCNISPAYSIDGSGDQPFDICESTSQSSKKGGPVKLKPPLLATNKQKRKEEERSRLGLCLEDLRPGIIYLRKYLNLADQVKIVETCRELGKASGGFYQPSFSSGHKMHLHVMCLGKNWDPVGLGFEVGTYQIQRYRNMMTSVLMMGLVQRVLQDAQGHPKNDSKLGLPAMNPDICIVNFYSKSGKLGLHQDKDESDESIRNGLPVVSFSVGDSAAFLFGVDRDVEKAKECKLDSGDVLIFGGESRLIFHGVPTIFPDTAPKQLLEQSKLRPGRLNLTFRQY
ncbi:Alpha-ketoglutarate-dependent dioxygenase AlkB-like protein [Nymphaea thermarum]|nr:Alpha-ketoglutarate-dependent dioxygenase AlkB-like protein [Nymphaea thermarum]